MEMLQPIVVITSSDIRNAERYLRRQVISADGSLSANVSEDGLDEASASVPVSTSHLHSRQCKLVHSHPVKTLGDKPLVLISASDVAAAKRILPRHKRVGRNDRGSALARRRQFLRKAPPTQHEMPPCTVKTTAGVTDVNQLAIKRDGHCCGQVNTESKVRVLQKGRPTKKLLHNDRQNVELPCEELRSGVAIATSCVQDVLSNKLPDLLSQSSLSSGRQARKRAPMHQSLLCNEQEEHISPEAEVDKCRLVSTGDNNFSTSQLELRLKALADEVNLLEKRHLAERGEDLCELKKSIAGTLGEVAGLFKNHPSLVRNCHVMAYAVSPCKEHLTKIECYAKNGYPLELPLGSFSQTNLCVEQITEDSLKEELFRDANQEPKCNQQHIDAAIGGFLVQYDTSDVPLHSETVTFVARKTKHIAKDKGFCLPDTCEELADSDRVIDGTSGILASNVPKVGDPNTLIDTLIHVLNHLRRKILTSWDSNLCEANCNQASLSCGHMGNCSGSVRMPLPSNGCAKDLQGNENSQSLLDLKDSHMHSVSQVPNFKLDKTTDVKLMHGPVCMGNAIVQIPSTDSNHEDGANNHSQSTMKSDTKLLLPVLINDLENNLNQCRLVSKGSDLQLDAEQTHVNKRKQCTSARTDTNVNLPSVGQSPNIDTANKVDKNFKRSRPAQVESNNLKVDTVKVMSTRLTKVSKSYTESQSKSKADSEMSEVSRWSKNNLSGNLNQSEARANDAGLFQEAKQVSSICSKKIFHENKESWSCLTLGSDAKNVNRKKCVTTEDNLIVKQFSLHNCKNVSPENECSQLTVPHSDTDMSTTSRVSDTILDENLNRPKPIDANIHLESKQSSSIDSKPESHEPKQSRRLRPLHKNPNLSLETKLTSSSKSKKETTENEPNQLLLPHRDTNTSIAVVTHISSNTLEKSLNRCEAVPADVTLKLKATQAPLTDSKYEDNEKEQNQSIVSQTEDNIAKPVVSCFTSKKLSKRSCELRPLFMNSNLRRDAGQTSLSYSKTAFSESQQNSLVQADVANSLSVISCLSSNTLDNSLSLHTAMTADSDVDTQAAHSKCTEIKNKYKVIEQSHSIVLPTKVSLPVVRCIADNNLPKDVNCCSLVCEKKSHLNCVTNQVPSTSFDNDAAGKKQTTAMDPDCSISSVSATSNNLYKNLTQLRQELNNSDLHCDKKQTSSPISIMESTENKQNQFQVHTVEVKSVVSRMSNSNLDKKLELHKSFTVDCNSQLIPKGAPLPDYIKETDEYKISNLTLAQTDSETSRSVDSHSSSNNPSETFTELKPSPRNSNLHHKAKQNPTSCLKRKLSKSNQRRSLVIQTDVNTNMLFVKHASSNNTLETHLGRKSPVSKEKNVQLTVKTTKFIESKKDSNAAEQCPSIPTQTNTATLPLINRTLVNNLSKNFTNRAKHASVISSETNSPEHLQSELTRELINNEGSASTNNLSLNTSQVSPVPISSTLQVSLKPTSTSFKNESTERESMLLETDKDASIATVSCICKTEVVNENNSNLKPNAKHASFTSSEKDFQRSLRSQLKLMEVDIGNNDACSVRPSQADIVSTVSVVDPVLENHENGELTQLVKTHNAIMSFEIKQLPCAFSKTRPHEKSDSGLVETNTAASKLEVKQDCRLTSDNDLNPCKPMYVESCNSKFDTSHIASKHQTHADAITPIVNCGSSICLDYGSSQPELLLATNSNSKLNIKKIVPTDSSVCQVSIEHQCNSAQSDSDSTRSTVSSVLTVCLHNDGKLDITQPTPANTTDDCDEKTDKQFTTENTDVQPNLSIARLLSSSNLHSDLNMPTHVPVNNLNTKPNENLQPFKKGLTHSKKDSHKKNVLKSTAVEKAPDACMFVVGHLSNIKTESLHQPRPVFKKPQLGCKNRVSKCVESGANSSIKLDSSLKELITLPMDSASLILDAKSRKPIVVLSRLSIVDIKQMCTVNQETKVPNVPKAKCTKSVRTEEHQTLTSTAQLCKRVTTAGCIKTLMVKKVVDGCVSSKCSRTLRRQSHTDRSKPGIKKDQRNANWKRRLRERRAGGKQKCKPLHVKATAKQDCPVKSLVGEPLPSAEFKPNLLNKGISSASLEDESLASHTKLANALQFIKISKSKLQQSAKLCAQKTVRTLGDLSSSNVIITGNITEKAPDGNESRNEVNTNEYVSETKLELCTLEAELVATTSVNNAIIKPVLRKRKDRQNPPNVNLHVKRAKCLENIVGAHKACPTLNDPLPPSAINQVIENATINVRGSVLNNNNQQEKSNIDEGLMKQSGNLTDSAKSKKKQIQHNTNKCVLLSHKKISKLIASNVTPHEPSTQIDKQQNCIGSNGESESTPRPSSLHVIKVSPNSTEDMMGPKRRKRRSVEETLITVLPLSDDDCKVRLRERNRPAANQTQQAKKTRKKVESVETQTPAITESRSSFEMDELFKTYVTNRNFNPVVLISHADMVRASKFLPAIKCIQPNNSKNDAQRRSEACSKPTNMDAANVINDNPSASVVQALPENRHFVESVSAIMGAPVIEKLLSGLRSFALPNCKNVSPSIAEDSSCETTVQISGTKGLVVKSVSDILSSHVNMSPIQHRSPSQTPPVCPRLSGENISSSQTQRLPILTADSNNTIAETLRVDDNRIVNNKAKNDTITLKTTSDESQTESAATNDIALPDDGSATDFLPISDNLRLMPVLPLMADDANDTQEMFKKCTSICTIPINVSLDKQSSSTMANCKMPLLDSNETAEKNSLCNSSEHNFGDVSIPLDLSSVKRSSVLTDLTQTEFLSNSQSDRVTNLSSTVKDHSVLGDGGEHHLLAVRDLGACEETVNVLNSEQNGCCMVDDSCEEQQGATQDAGLFDQISNSLPSLSDVAIKAPSKDDSRMLSPVPSIDIRTTPETIDTTVSNAINEKTVEDIAVDTLRAAALSVQDSLRCQSNVSTEFPADAVPLMTAVSEVASEECGGNEDGDKLLAKDFLENESLAYNQNDVQEACLINVSLRYSSPAVEDKLSLQGTNCGIAVDKLIAATLQIDDVSVRDHSMISEPELVNSELEEKVTTSEVANDGIVVHELLSAPLPDGVTSAHDGSSPPEHLLTSDVDDIDVAKLLATTLTENESAENNLSGTPEASSSDFTVKSTLPYVNSTPPYMDTTMISRDDTGDDIDVDKLLATSPESEISTHQSASPYINTGSPYTNAGSPYVNSGSPYLSTGSPYVSTGSPYVSTGSPYVNNGSPYVSTGSPYINNASPYVNNNSPYVSNLSPYVNNQMNANEHANDDIDVDKLLAVTLPSDDTSVGSHAAAPGVGLTNFPMNSTRSPCVDSSAMANEETSDGVHADNLLATTSPFNDPPLYRPVGSPETGLSDLPDESFVDGSMMADDESSNYSGAQMLSESPSINASDMTVIPNNLDSFDPAHTSTASQTADVLQLENGDVVFVMDSANYIDSQIYLNADSNPSTPTTPLTSVSSSGSKTSSTESSLTAPSFVQSRPTAVVDPMPQNASSDYMSQPTSAQSDISHTPYNTSGAATITVHDTNQRIFSTTVYNPSSASNAAPTNSFMPLASNYVVPVYTPNATVPVNIPIQAWPSCMPNLPSNVVPPMLQHQGSVQFQNVMATSTLACDTQWNVASGNQATINMPPNSGPVPYVAQNASHPMLIGVPFSNDPQQFHVFAAQPQLNSVVASTQNGNNGASVPHTAHSSSFTQLPSLLSTNTVVCDSQNSGGLTTGYANVSGSAPYMIPHMSESGAQQPTVFGMPFASEPQVHIFSTQHQMQGLVNAHNGGGIPCNMMLASSSCGLPQVPQAVISTTSCGVTSSTLQNTSVNFPLTLPTAEVAMLNHESNSLFYQNGILFPDDIPQHEITIADGSEQSSSNMCTSAEQTYLGQPYAIQCQPHKYGFSDETDAAVHLVPRNIGSLLPKSHREEKKLLSSVRPACPICGKVYSYPANVQRHMNIVHKQYEARRSARTKRT